MNTENTENTEAEKPANEPAALALGNVDTLHGSGNDAAYWNALIDEAEAADFLDLAKGTLSNYRQAGIGARFVRISSRCVKYRRCDLKAWCDDHLRSSTSDTGPDQEAA